MRKINKSTEPDVLVQAVREGVSHYNDLSSSVRSCIRDSLIAEQYSLCAYCCRKIHNRNGAKAGNCHNEHIVPQGVNSSLSLDYNNMVASCNLKICCGHAHRNRTLNLTPLMDECEGELRFLWNGCVEGLTPRAQEMISILNLGDTYEHNRSLVDYRRRMIEFLLLGINGYSSQYDIMEDDEVLQILRDDLSNVSGGEMEEFAPVAINIIDGWLSR